MAPFDVRVVVALALVAIPLAATAEVPVETFFRAASRERPVAEAALQEIARQWRPGYAALLLDLARMFRPSSRPRPMVDVGPMGMPAGSRLSSAGAGLPEIGDPGSPERRRLLQFLERQTSQRFGDDLDRWRKWTWSLPAEPLPVHVALKRRLYAEIDPRMATFFPDGVAARIRLDEVDWGGVRVNGIPPLRNPAVVTASEAKYLRDSDIVFGIEVGGVARAYPKRILAWHELALDRLGRTDLAVVYCTLCGTVIPFETRVGATDFHFGTSGLLYRSNKLMFDEGTGTLWSAIEGAPVIGPLARSGIRLAMRAVVTTTWREWRQTHPGTTVLSIDTGYTRDYAEGAAYRDYFASPDLLFPVSAEDRRLNLKDEVLVLRLPSAAGAIEPLAIDVRLLRRNPLYTFSHGGRRYLVVTTPAGANRVYEGGIAPPKQRVGRVLRDESGQRWGITESGLVPESGGSALPRVPAQRAFWFAWYAQFPGTVLIK